MRMVMREMKWRRLRCRMMDDVEKEGSHDDEMRMMMLRRMVKRMIMLRKMRWRRIMLRKMKWRMMKLEMMM